MIKNIIFLVFIITNLNLCQAQNLSKQNLIYLELGGNGLFSSLNYERQLFKNTALSLRIGLGFYTEKAFYLTIPMGLNYAFKLNKVNSFLDLGMGVTFARIDGRVFAQEQNENGTHFTNVIPSIAYRKHNAQDYFWRISFTPVFNRQTVMPWVGFSIGKRF